MAESLVIYNNPFERDFWEALHSGLWLPALAFFVSFIIVMAVLSKITAPRSIRYQTFDYIRLCVAFLIAVAVARYAMILTMG